MKRCIRQGQHVHHDHPHLGRCVLDRRYEAVTVVIAEGGVQDHHLRLDLADSLQRPGRAVHCGDDLEVRLLG
jgi:hypothetical protein